MISLIDIIYYIGLVHCITIALYWILGVEGSIRIGNKDYDWDYMIWIPTLNLLALIAIIIELTRPLFSLFKRRK